MPTFSREYTNALKRQSRVLPIKSPSDFQDAAMRCGKGEFIVRKCTPMAPQGTGGIAEQFRWHVVWPEENNPS